MAADLTVMPLIASSDYREFISLVATAKLGPLAGDLHPESLVHAIMALDIKSRLIQESGDGFATALKLPRDVALGWIGGSIDVYLDDDPFWAELAQAKDPDEFMRKHAMQLPLGVHVPVTDAAKLALFLNAVRFYADQSAPNLVTWQNREHHGQRYVRVAQKGEGAPGPETGPPLAIYYAPTPRGLVVSLNEQVVTRFIDRQAKQPDSEKRKAIEPPAAEPSRPWLGESLAARVSSAGFRVLATAGLDHLPRRDFASVLEQPADPERVASALPRPRPGRPARGGLGRAARLPRRRPLRLEPEVADHGVNRPRPPGRAQTRTRYDRSTARCEIRRLWDHLPGRRPARHGRDRTASRALITAFSFGPAKSGSKTSNNDETGRSTKNTAIEKGGGA